MSFSHSRLLFSALLFICIILVTACNGGGGFSGSSSSSSGGAASGGGATTGGGGTGGGGTTGGTGGSVNPGEVFDGSPPEPVPEFAQVAQISADLKIENPSRVATTRARVTANSQLNTNKAFGLNLTTKNITALQIVSDVGGREVATYYFKSPAGDTLLSFKDNPIQTTAVRIEGFINSLPYPARPQNPRLIDGKYTQLVYMGGNVGSQFRSTILGKNDPNLGAGVLRVNLFLVGTTAQRAEAKDAVERATNIWREIYRAAGITLNVRSFNVASATGVIPSPLAGSLFYSNLTAGQDVAQLALNVFIGATISKDGSENLGNVYDGEDAIFGVAAAIPGPSIPTVRTGVAISLNTHDVNQDSIYSSEEISILGETFAHEGGHYLGLFHPVNINARTGGYVEGDPLSDTAVCATDAACIAAGLASNNMFPTPVPGIPTQRNLTLQQSQVLNLQVIVD